MKRPTLTFFVALSVLSAVFLSALDPSIGFPMAEAQLKILNDTGYLDTFGCYRVLGELENVGDQAVAMWEIGASFYNPSHSLISTMNFNTSTLHSPVLDTINPGKKSPFEIVLSNRTQAAEVDYYSVEVLSYDVRPPKPIGLEITESKSSTDAFRNIIISGIIKNTGNEATNSVKVIATWYNSQGSVVAIGYCFTDPDNIEPSLTLPFQIELASVGPYPINKITGYVLEAESSEYAMVPEFPSYPGESPSMPLALIAAILLIFLIGVVLLAAFAVAWRRKHSIVPASKFQNECVSESLASNQ